MTAAAILHNKGGNVVTVKGDDTLINICSVLRDHRIGAVVVVDTKDKVIGILSERDIVRAIARDGKGVLSSTASDFMTRDVVTCSLGDTVQHMMEKMTERRFRHLPVVDQGRLVGIVSIGDVVKQRIADVEHDAQALREYIATG